jgi:uncharacterized protein
VEGWRFEWDNTKSQINYYKHGIDFATAVHAFRDRFHYEWIDDREDYGEERVKLVGMAGGVLIALIYTERNGVLRIISARRATRAEHDEYHKQAPSR